MSQIFGHLNIDDSDRAFNIVEGQMAMWDAATAYVNRINEDLIAAMSIFVERTTSDFKFRYKLPGGGYLSRRSPDGRFPAAKALGSWDVAFPLEDFGSQIAGNDVDMAYMTVAELDRHIQTVTAQNVNTVRFEILKALYNSAQDTFVDDIHGSLAVEPLANGDTVTFPPVLGASSEATDNHYLESSYAASAISDTNDPYATIAAELEEHFGAPTGGSQIACFIHPDQVSKTRDLTDFVPVGDMGIAYGNDADLAARIPPQLLRVGRVLGRMDGAGVWVVEWRYMTTAYILGVHLDAEPPLIRRIDPADTGLGDGLQLVSEDEEFPFKASFWRHRFGFGAGNRLNGVMLELGTGGTYSVPAAYQ